MHATVLRVLEEGLVAVSIAAINAVVSESPPDHPIIKGARDILCDCGCAEEE